MENKRFKTAIIGGGPAGYALAIKLAMKNAPVILLEKEKIGGTCLNKGCIPTKSILHNSDLINKTKTLEKFGVALDLAELDFAKLVEHKDKTVEKLNKSLGMLLKSFDIEIVNEEVLSFEKNKIFTAGGVYECDTVVIATGTKPAQIKGLEADNKFIYNSDGILKLGKLPKSILIIGSGAIGIEWSRIFSDLGVDVTLVEAMDRILPTADSDVSARVERLLKKKRVKIEKSATVNYAQNGEVSLSNGKILTPEIVLVAIGRSPVLPNSEYEFETNRGYLKVDKNFMTNIEGIYAIGDINGQCMLAHSATHQAIELAEYLADGKKPDFFEKEIPSVIYGMPEIAWFGASEDKLTADGAEVKKVLFPISAVGKAHTDEEIDGFVKILTVGEKIAGVSIVAPEASAMLMQFLIAKENNLPYTAVTNAIFPHPTFSEAVFEAVLALDNKSLSLPKIKEEKCACPNI